MAENDFPSFSHLPTDALCLVFQHLFEPLSAERAGVPLSEFVQLWRTARLVCKHWSEVLVAHPPLLHLDISTLPDPWLAWLPSLPVQTLRIQSGLDQRWTASADGSQAGSAATGLPAGMPGPMAAQQLVAGLEGCGGSQPFWALAPFTRLRHLHLRAPVSRPGEPAVFDSAALQGLEQLAVLSLGSFADFKLDRLPASLRRLALSFDGQNQELSVPALPDHISRLELLRVEKPGALGVCLDELAGRVLTVELHAHELLLGVTVADPKLIRTFERPYREGNFVPPHIWGDEEADDNSKHAAELAANHWLASLPESTMLERFRLCGPAAHSCKFMPVAAPSQRDSLKWLWSVVRLQGLHNLYGLSGREMQARQQLFEGRLAIEQDQAAFCIRVVQRTSALSGSGSAP
ncbi:hypothetical protein ABPG77_006171 [Micractinium sp. CCAP 211/92]